MDIDYESRQPIHTPAYYTSEQSTLQTPDSLCLDPHTTLANTYDDFRVTTYNLRLTHISLVRSPPQVSLSSQYLRLTTYDLRFPSYDLQLTTYDFPALLCWDLLPPTTTSSLSVQSLSAASQPKPYGDFFRVTTYNLQAGTGTHTHTHLLYQNIH